MGEFDFPYIIECSVKIIASVFFGLILGLERKSRNHVVGTRTLILICVSSCLLAILSGYTARGEDSSRISAQVVSGVGFLGGGAIMRQGLNIKGLTSAAVIWTAASLGLALGSGLYIQAGLVLILIVALLVVLERFEGKFFPAARNKALHLCFENENVDMEKLKQTILDHHFIICDLNISRVISINKIILHYSVQAPKEDDFTSFIEDLKKIGNLSEFSITD